MFKKWVYIPALLALCLPLAARDIFVTPGESSSTISVYSADPLIPVGSVPGPAGSFQVLRASATKFYVISRVAVDAVTVYEGAPGALAQTKRFNLPQAPTAAGVSPDGRRVVVVAGDVSIFDTATDTNLTTPGIGAGASPNSIAISLDSSRAFVLSPTTQRLTAIDLNTRTAAGTATIPGIASQVVAAPNGFIYVTAPNSLLEYDPRNLATTTISLNAFPSNMAFTPDGRGAVLINTEPRTGSSLIYVDLTRRTFVAAPALGGASLLEKIVVTDNNTAYAYSTQTGRLYSTRVTPGSDAALTLTPIAGGNVVLEGVKDIAASNEVQARFLLVTTLAGLFRVDSTGAIIGPVAVPALGSLSVNSAPLTTGAATVTALNDTQAIQQGQASLPLTVRVTDAAGNPVANVPVSYVPNVAGATIVNAMAATNNQGLAVAYLNPPADFTTGTITVNTTATGTAVPAAFTIRVGSGSTGVPSTPALQIFSGNGQAVSNFSSIDKPLTVIVRDAAGKPLPGVNVTWTLTEGAGNVSPAVSITDDKGLATAGFVGSIVTGGAQYQTNTITASTGTETVTFFVATLANAGGGTPGRLNVFTRTPFTTVIQGRAGQTITGAIRYDVVAPNGAPVRYIGISLETTQLDAAGNPAVSCRGGTQLSDEAGAAVCDLVLGNFIGELQAVVNIAGGTRLNDVFTIRISPGEANSIRILQGSGQSANAGQPLPTPLVAEFRDAFQNLLSGVDVQWEVAAGSANFAQVQNRTDTNGRAQATVTLGQTPGPIQIRVRSGTATATFSLTANVPASAITKVSGEGQSAPAGQPFAQPLSVRVTNAQGQPVAGAQVVFAPGAGSTGTVTFGSPAAVTSTDGVASTTVAAGSTMGAVTVRVSVGSISDTFNLTVRAQGPGFAAASIVNAAGFQPGISPGSIAFISATGIKPTQGSVTPQTIVGPLPTQLAGVEVRFNDIAAPIFAVSNVNGQESVVVQVPFEVTASAVPVMITVTGGGSTTVPGVQILPIKPGVFESADTSGRRYPVATRPDGSYVSPTNPARRGEIIRVFATGLGQTTPATGTNRAGQPDQNVAAPIVVGVNNRGVRVVSAQLQPGSVGVYVVAFEVPADTEAGAAAPFAIAAAGADGSLVFGNGTSIPIQ